MKEIIKYFRAISEDYILGEGRYYVELKDWVVQRQVHIFGGEMFWASPDNEKSAAHPFTDQPDISSLKEDIELLGAVEISAQEFEGIWNESLK